MRSQSAPASHDEGVEHSRSVRIAPAGLWREAWVFALSSLWLSAYAILRLGTSLPGTYLAANWRATWVAFDLGLAALIALDTALLLRRSRVLPVALGMTAGCFICDAWFDCATSGASASAVVDTLGELPAAAVCIWVALRRA